MGLRLQLAEEIQGRGEATTSYDNPPSELTYNQEGYSIERIDDVCRVERKSEPNPDESAVVFNCKEGLKKVVLGRSGIDFVRNDDVVFRVSPILGPSPLPRYYKGAEERFQQAESLENKKEPDAALAVWWNIAEDPKAKLNERLKAAGLVYEQSPVIGEKAFQKILSGTLSDGEKVQVYKRLLRLHGKVEEALKEKSKKIADLEDQVRRALELAKAARPANVDLVKAELLRVLEDSKKD